ncbi:MAG: DUF4384 domain-containing protein [Bacteroidetes bacterium]|nr:DUF4384 domain-containing protein [Bacteroidota bacterium]
MTVRAFLLTFLFVLTAAAQEKGSWVTGKATAYGTDIAKMQADAVKRARADALNQAGIVVSASSFRVQSESNTAMNDYYSQFTEATSRGIITQERNIAVSDPVRVTGSSKGTDKVFQVTAELEAYVVIPEGTTDPAYTVTVKTSRTSYRESEPVLLEITASKDSYITIVNVKNDSIQVPLPNVLLKENAAKAKKSFLFPNGFELYLTVDEGEKSGTEEFIIIATREPVPVMQRENGAIIGGELVLPKLTMTELSQWLASIPLHQRCIAHTVLTVVK